MKNKKIIAIVAIVLVAVIAVSAVFIFGGKQDYMKNESTVGFISTAIRVLKDSQFKDRDLIKEIYANAFYKKPVINDNFPEKLEGTLPTLIDGAATSELYKAVVKGLYGGKAVKTAINGIEGEPSKTVKEKDLYVGDLLFIKKSDATKYYIYDKDGLVDLSDALSKIDTKAVLDTLPESEIFAVFRPMKIMDNYDFITEELPELELSEAQEAVIATANSYLLRGGRIQYADTYLSNILNSEYRWQIAKKSPEDCTTDEWGYLNCAAFTYDVYYYGLGMDMNYADIKLNKCKNLMQYSEELGIRKYYMQCEYSNEYTEEEKEKIVNDIMDTLQPADILVVRRDDGSGHALLYIGNGNIIHCTGSAYNYSKSKENYEASIIRARFKDYFLTEGSRGYIFGRDTGVNVNSFAIVRPIDIFEGEIPEASKNRAKNMNGIMAEKVSSHNSAKSVGPNQEMTFTFNVYNTNDESVTVDISDKVPANTTYVSGAEKQDGDKLSWKLTLPANTRKSVSYTVKVNENAKYGDTVQSNDSKVGGVSINCPAVLINRTLSQEEQTKIADAIKKVDAKTSLKGLELINEVYKNALGVENVFADTDVETVLTGEDGVFNITVNVDATLSYHKLNAAGKYRDMMVPTLYGGRSFYRFDWCDRTRLAKEHYLVVGDVLIRKRLGENQIFIYAGEGKFYNLSKGCVVDEYTAAKRLEICLSTENVYTVLRPSFGMN